MRRMAAVVGHPVAHSLSPRVFAGFARATATELDYSALDVTPDDLGAVMRAAARAAWIGWNVTLPHQVAVLDHLDVVGPSAIAARAANVVRFARRGSEGHNTDVEGFLAPLARRGVRLAGMRATVLGAGGASRAVCCALRSGGAAEIRVVGRDAARTLELAALRGVVPVTWTPEGVTDSVVGSDIVVNATPLGTDGAASPLPAGARFRSGAIAYDLVYRHRETPFLRRARDCGADVVGGLGMLVAQAAATWRIWFGEALPPGVEERIEASLLRGLP